MPSFFDLSGHVGLVTGGNGGIGLGMAKGLAECGADVVIWGTNPEKNERATKELEALGVKVLAQKVDVGDEEQVDTAFAEAVEAMGKVDSCFANAGVGAGAPLQDMTLDMWRHNQRVNSEGAFLTFRAAARHKITVNSILPGWIETDMTQGAFSYDKFVDNVMPRIPHRRWGQPSDFSGIAAYLASPASRYHTGDTIVVDGAYTIF